jgi:hypothetical protein
LLTPPDYPPDHKKGAKGGERMVPQWMDEETMVSWWLDDGMTVSHIHSQWLDEGTMAPAGCGCGAG